MNVFFCGYFCKDFKRLKSWIRIKLPAIFRFLLSYLHCNCVLLCLAAIHVQALTCGQANSPCHQNVVVVGAGLAGLTAAYELNKAGVPVVLYEARNQIGGKVRSTVHYGIQVEEGGLFINSDHKIMMDYAKNLGLDLIDKTKSDVSGFPIKTVYLLGSEELSSKAFYERYRSLIEYLGNNPYTPEQLDLMSYKQLLEQVPAVSSTLREEFMQYAQQTYSAEYGIDIGKANANQFYQMATIDLVNEEFSFVGQIGDERWRILGGNQALAHRMAKTLPPGSIYLKHRLRKVSQTKNGHYKLVFSISGFGASQLFPSIEHTVLADQLVLAIPLNHYRIGHDDNDSKKVLLDLPELSIQSHQHDVFDINKPVKSVIEDINFGDNYKLVLFFKENVWINKNQKREIATVVHPKFMAWNAGKDGGRSTNSAVTFYISGSETKQKFPIPEILNYANIFTKAVKNIMPLASLDNLIKIHQGIHWPSYRFSLGSYGGALLPGQWHQYGQWFKQPLFDRMAFAGSEWSQEYYGFMNGAVETGRHAADHLLKRGFRGCVLNHYTGDYYYYLFSHLVNFDNLNVPKYYSYYATFPNQGIIFETDHLP